MTSQAIYFTLIIVYRIIIALLHRYKLIVGTNLFNQITETSDLTEKFGLRFGSDATILWKSRIPVVGFKVLKNKNYSSVVPGV
jgi:hypothetical protein